MLVEARLAAPGRVLIRRPEARGIGRQHFINQDELALKQTELEFRVRNDDAALAGVITGEMVNLQARRARLPRELVADDLLRLLE